jgi:hypothetical protein
MPRLIVIARPVRAIASGVGLIFQTPRLPADGMMPGNLR